MVLLRMLMLKFSPKSLIPPKTIASFSREMHVPEAFRILQLLLHSRLSNSYSALLSSSPPRSTSKRERGWRIVRVVELAGSVMDELANATGPRNEAVANHCREFMQSIKTPILWSHGMADRTVLFEAGQAGPPFLEQAGMKCEFKAYPDLAHSISNEELQTLESWIDSSEGLFMRITIHERLTSIDWVLQTIMFMAISVSQMF